jgi:hypothetical protein
MRRIGSVAAGAVAVLVLGCGGSGGGDGSAPQVLEGEAGVQAAAQAVVSLADAVRLLLEDSAGGALGALATGAPSTGSRAVRISCPLGGSLDGDCRESGGRTTVVTASERCSLFDEERGVVVVVNGRADATYRATGICADGRIPDGVASRLALRGYREEWRDRETVLRVAESDRFDADFEPLGDGCSANQGRSMIEGDLRIRTKDEDFAIRARNLALDVSSSGNPCDESVAVRGRIDVDDAVRGARFEANTDGLSVSIRRALDGVIEVALDGDVTFDCVGPVGIATEERLALAVRCPVEGELALTIGDESPVARFGIHGLSLDYDGDGASELTSASCSADSQRVCM